MIEDRLPLNIPRGWMCPMCCKVLSPDVTEHSCGMGHFPSPFSPPGDRVGGCEACKGGVCSCYRPELGPHLR